MTDENVITPEVDEGVALGSELSGSDSIEDTEIHGEASLESELEAEDLPLAVSDTDDRLAELQRRQSIDAEYLEFARLFPGCDVSSLPDSVCESVRAGVPLAAAYALYEKKKSFESYEAHEKNSKNASLSFPISESGTEKYFSPDEVKSMSREEVRTNYKRIIESMRHWH